MVEPLRHRQTKEAATDMFYLPPPRHISTLPFTSLWLLRSTVRMSASHPKATESPRSSEMTLSARKRHMHRSKQHHYSITSSARAGSVGGTSRPIAFATIRLTTRSNLVGCSTGRSGGEARRKILSIKSPRREGHRPTGVENSYFS